ncbi:MAG TPA: 3-oxoacyl-ACP reductase [Chloroflexi bacterium]|jgi:3-oxoacyl-[acyl-carrier protein] reductase|nr:3-oxoacyl-ACP reductase [Chloroflexota bacterium]
MDLKLAGTRALVTAASRGLGRACAAALANEGARVFICARDASSLAITASSIKAAGHKVADVSKADDVTALVETVVAELGGLDILITNAGGPPPGSFGSVSWPQWDGSYALTLMSVARLIRECLPHLTRSDRGRIVNITSISARQPLENLLLSNVFRPAVTGLAKTLSLELAPHRITVNNIAPEAILTDRVRQVAKVAAERAGQQLDEFLEGYSRSIPLGRLGDAEEVGALCAFLCSVQASYITGQTIGIDGGQLKGLH